MKGKWLVFSAGLLFVLLSYAVEWQAADGQGWQHTNPDGLRNIGLVLLFLWLLFGYVVPLYFWRRCPYCPGTTLGPVYLEIVESEVHPGGTDDRGGPLPPIIRRDYVCPQCGFRQVTYRYLPPRVYSVFGRHGFERSLGRLDHRPMTTSRRVVFHTFQEWKAYYDALKATEREEWSRK